VTEGVQSYADLESAFNAHFRGHDTRPWEEWRRIVTTKAEDVPQDATRAWLNREKASHRGIGRCKGLSHLIAGAADQSYLEEIATLDRLERLELEWPVTATSLAPLGALTRLRFLSIDSPRHIEDFTPVLALPALRTLLLTNAKHLRDLDWLAEAHHLEVLGVEGSINTVQTITSLRPLAGLRGLRAFLATSTRLLDKDLSPLAACPRLEFLDCARFAPRPEFERLQALCPGLVCSWFRPGMWSAKLRSQ